MRAWLVAALALALVACGGATDDKPPTAKQLRACSVHVYFRRDATRAEEQRVGTRLRHDARVRTVTFISKAAALAQMKQKDPVLMQPLSGNPLPDAYAVVPMDLADSPRIGASIARAHWPGIAKVNSGGGAGLRRANGCPT